jgi:quercetin dioxygenase-like cupin family protein
MTIIRQADARRTETPNAVMTTLASPSLGGAEHSLWRVDMAPGQSGPAHRFDCQQVWTALRGRATIDLDGETVSLAEGDTVVLAADAPRRIHADGAVGFAAMVAGDPRGRAVMPDGTDRGTPAWIG